jgi:outer membrane protein assembly factor BamB
MKRSFDSLALPLFLSGALLQAAAAPSPSFQETWSQWRGPDRDGRYLGEAWPDSLSENNLRLSWRRELGPGYSSPVLDRRHVYTVETEDEQREVVRALDRRTGKQAWESRWDGAMKVPFFAKANGSWVRCTPLLDDDRLYVGGMRDVLVCLSAKDGKEIWRADFPKQDETPLPSFGFVSSPVVDQEHIYVQAGGGFVKLDKRTGEKVWKSLGDGGGMFGSAFSSPVIGEIRGKRLALVQTRQNLAGVDLESGQTLWEEPIKAFRGMNILTPIIFADGLFTSAYGGRSSFFRTARTGKRIRLTQAWDNKLQGYMSTPVVVGNHAYLHLRNTRMACVDLTDGTINWTSSKTFGKYLSLVVQNDRILALDQKGNLYLLRATPDRLVILDERKVSDQETWAHLAIADRQLFVRELNGLRVFDWN